MRFPLRIRIVAYIVAWSGALFATDPTLKLWPLVYMFPLGLAAFFLAPEHRQSPGPIVFALIVAGYIVHAVIFFRTRSHRTAFILFLVLVAALICNVSGCREMNNAH